MRERPTAWKKIRDEDVTTFFERWYYDDILAAADSNSGALTVSVKTLDKWRPDFSDGLLAYPDEVLEIMERVLHNMDLPIDSDLSKIRIRLKDLPVTQQVKVSDIRSDHIGQLIEVTGLVRASTEVRPRIVSSAFECQRCGHVFFKSQNASKFQEPYDCPNEACDRRGPFKLLLNRSQFIDAQNVKVQEKYEDLDAGEIPQTIDVQLEADLTARVYPGDVVAFVGILRSYQRATPGGKSTYFDIFLDSRGVYPMNQVIIDLELDTKTEKEIRKLARRPTILNDLAGSLVPYIHGHDDIKRAVALQLFSAPAVKRKDGNTVRGDIHILLVGDPGMAKSQILRRVVKLSPRSVYTSGKTASGVGLTAAAVRDDQGRWSIEGGALVLADGGFAAIDELDKIGRDDQSTIHEALEHQTISFTKAGLHAVLSCRTPVLAACNPKHERFDLMEPIAGQLGIPPALLSRFDLTFALIDHTGANQSEELITHILSSYTEEASEPIIPEDVVRRYVMLARREIADVGLTDEAGEILKAFYLGLRKEAEEKQTRAVPITIRQFEALVRLTKASARMKLKTIAEASDAKTAVDLMTASMGQICLDPETGEYNSAFIEGGAVIGKAARMDLIRKLIKDFERRNGEPPTLEQIQADADYSGKVPPESTEKIIQDMMRNGEIIQPRFGVYRAV